MVYYKYLVSMGSVVLDSEDKATADLISFESTNDCQTSDYTLDLVGNNKGWKYNYRINVNDPVFVVMEIIDEITKEPVQRYNVFTGVVATVDWNYKEFHVTGTGFLDDLQLNAAGVTHRIYHKITSWYHWIHIIEDLITDYNATHPQSKLAPSPVLIGEEGEPPMLDHFEMSQSETAETVLADIMNKMGAVSFSEANEDGTSTMYVLIGRSIGSQTLVLSPIYNKAVFDSVAVNEIGYCVGVVVHGRPVNIFNPDYYVHSSQEVMGKYYPEDVDPSKAQPQFVVVNDPGCHTQLECEARARSLWEQMNATKNVIKPVFMNCCPILNTNIIYTDVAYESFGITINGVMLRRECTFDASLGMRCAMELGTNWEMLRDDQIAASESAKENPSPAAQDGIGANNGTGGSGGGAR